MEVERSTLFRKDWQWYLAMTVAVTIVLRFFVAANPPFGLVYSYLLTLSYATFLYPVCQQARKKRIPGFRLLLAGLVWAGVASLFHRYTEEQTAKLMSYLLLLLFAVSICYPTAFVLPAPRAGNTIILLSSVNVCLSALLSLLGIFAALTGRVLPSLAGADYAGIGSIGGRLYAFFFPSAFAMLASVSLLLIPYLYGSARKPMRVLLMFAAALIYLAMALTGATVVQLLFAVCSGGFVFLLTLEREKPARIAPRVLVALALAAVTIAVCMSGQYLVKRAADSIAPAPVAAKALPAAESGAQASERLRLSIAPAAKTASEETVQEPSALGFVALRVTLWKGLFQLVSDDPVLLVSGASPVLLGQRLAPYLPDGTVGANLRILPLQALAVFGLPGLILTLAFSAYVLCHAIRLFFCGKGFCTVFERSLALVPLFLLLCDCTDCYLTLTDSGALSSLWFFLSAGYVVLLSTTRIPKKNAA